MVNISFKGNINHKSGIYGSRRLTLGKKERIKAYKIKIPKYIKAYEIKIPKYLKELNKVDGKSFVAGNLTSTRKSKMLFKRYH